MSGAEILSQQEQEAFPANKGEGSEMATIDSVVRTHGAALLAYATRLTGGDRQIAEDIVQETWLRAWRHLDRLTEDRGSVRGWLIRVAHNIAVDLRRRREARLTEVELPEQELPGLAVIPAPNDEVETRVVVDAVLDHLSAVHRHTLVEVYFADRTAASAASVLGVPVGTVKSRIHNALRALRALRDALPQPQLEAA
jgi:RNA polymerase sigma-70 factor (ECF subfamily)